MGNTGRSSGDAPPTETVQARSAVSWRCREPTALSRVLYADRMAQAKTAGKGRSGWGESRPRHDGPQPWAPCGTSPGLPALRCRVR
jgi:hypothetical protein